MNPSTPRHNPLTVDRIVETALRMVRRDGLAALSMRKLGTELEVDPMAVYHHVADKRSLLALVTARAMSEMVGPDDPSAPWDVRVRQWATGYWEVVAAHRELTLAGLADPEIGSGGLASTRSLVAAVADSGLADDLIEPTAFLIVDAVHGSAIGAASPGRHDADLSTLRSAFEVGLDTILAGITARNVQT